MWLPGICSPASRSGTPPWQAGGLLEEGGVLGTCVLQPKQMVSGSRQPLVQPTSFSTPVLPLEPSYVVDSVQSSSVQSLSRVRRFATP